MSYDVIARKWRPQTFGDVIGQTPVIRTLTNSIKAGRIHHSFIFAGLRGTGKTSTARILAKALNCKDGPTVTPCLKCVACDEITRGVDVDVFEIDAASNKGVDDIRDLKEIVKFPPIRDRYKIFIIDEAHMLSSHAFNALLKTIEEPPSYVVFILATTEVHKIPTTIRSRCQLFEFRHIPNREIEEQLKKIAETEKVVVEDGAFSLIVDAAEGSMRDAESLLDQVISFSGDKVKEDDVSTVLGIAGRRAHVQLLSAIAGSDAGAVIALLDELEDKNTDFLKFLVRFGSFLQEALHAVMRKDTDFFPEGFDSSRLSAEDMILYLNMLVQNEASAKFAFNARIAVELIVLKMVFSTHVVPLADLLSKKKSLKTESEPESASAHTVKQGKKNLKSAEITGSDKPKKQKLSPREVFDQACESFSHLRPFLSSADFTPSDSTLSIGFHQQIPRLIREEIEGEFRDRLGRDLARSEGHRVEISFSYFVDKEADSGQEKLKDHPLVKQVLDTFGGEVEAITDKEKI
ncbi:MAG: DNA polymerase III subunit gamma/tau [Acidobacteria bacterium]|nr:DNA polymerase III subunit gamma/tau [Acidobacteriota bacterium]